MLNATETVLRARRQKTVIPAYNIPYLSMVKPVIQAIVDENSIAMIQVARVEWEKFGAQSPEAVAKEYLKYANPHHTLLHLDHVPVIDEDQKHVDYKSILEKSIDDGYQSVMIDGSRLSLSENIEATKWAAELAHTAQIPCEAELGAVMGHESGPMMPYEELFATKKGFTNPEEAKLFAKESGCDWLSIAAGSVHGAVAENLRHQKKPEARLDIGHIAAIAEITRLPLVLHGGSGINVECIHQAIAAGIAKINVGTEIRQAFEFSIEKSSEDIEAAQDAVYQAVRSNINMLKIKNSRLLLYP